MNNQVQRNLQENGALSRRSAPGPMRARTRPWPGTHLQSPRDRGLQPSCPPLSRHPLWATKGPCEGHPVQACPRASVGGPSHLAVTVSYLTGSRGVCVPPGQVEAAVNRTSQTGLKQTFTPQSARGTPGSGCVLGRPPPGSSSQPFWGCPWWAGLTSPL